MAQKTSVILLVKNSVDTRAMVYVLSDKFLALHMRRGTLI